MTVGERIPRTDAADKVTGRARYVDDLTRPGLYFGLTVRSTIQRGRIAGIEFDQGFDWSSITVVDHRGIPGRNVVAMIEEDQPVLAEREIRHKHEPILLLAGPDRALLREAAARIAITYEKRPAVVSMDQALTRRQLIFGSNNVFKEIRISKGDVAPAFESPATIVEEVYTTSWQEQLYIEPQGMLAEWQGDTLIVTGSMQCPYYVQRALEVALGITGDRRVRVIQSETGGGFGGKEDYPSMIAIHAALLARASGRPVKLVYDRREDMAATTKRHPSEIVHRTAVSADGVLLGVQIDILLDGGAYCTLSPVVLSRCALHAMSAYRCDNVQIHARVVATNTPPNGAFRGFGAPQSIFACERHMDLIARRIGLSPLEIRRRNLLRPGDTTSTGQSIPDLDGLARVVDRAARESDFEARWRALEEAPASTNRRGIGISVFMHGNGFTGAGEKKLAGRVAVRLQLAPDAPLGVNAEILTASTEIGQGMRTIFRQIAADALDLDIEHVSVPPPDTSVVPDSGPTVASRTCMIVGGLVERTCRELRRMVGGDPSTPWARRLMDYVPEHGEPMLTLTHEMPPEIEWDEEHYRGSAYAAYGYACNVVEASVDMTTFEPTIESVLTCQDVGTAINPSIVEGQIEGGTVQGLAFGIMEEVVMSEGSMSNATMTDYIVPTAVDVPRVRVLLEGTPYEHGAFGAKGVGEMPIDGAAPPLISAIEQAAGIHVTDIPLTPERIAETWLARQAAERDA